MLGGRRPQAPPARHGAGKACASAVRATNAAKPVTLAAPAAVSHPKAGLLSFLYSPAQRTGVLRIMAERLALSCAPAFPACSAPAALHTHRAVRHSLNRSLIHHGVVSPVSLWNSNRLNSGGRKWGVLGKRACRPFDVGKCWK